LIKLHVSIRHVQQLSNFLPSQKPKSIKQYSHVRFPLLFIINSVVLFPFSLLPSTLSSIFPTNPDIVNRYTRLVKQKFYERTSNTIYCPRQLCHAPIIPSDPESKVVVCPRCTYPFCKFCLSSWHGLGIGCRLQNGYPSPPPKLVLIVE
jgi:IBR domain, a half RING-finger domain